MPASDVPVRRPTLDDVATAAGVSRSTASRALGDGASVSAATRARVRAAAQRLSFEPNRIARSLRRGSTMAVGIVVPDVGTRFYATALKAAHAVLEAAGYHPLVVSTDRAPERERAALRTLAAQQVDGLIVATSGGFDALDVPNVPTVFFDNVPSGTGSGAVALCNEHGVALLVEHLVRDHGQRAIAYVGPPDVARGAASPVVHAVGRERLDGFRAALGRAALPLPPEFVQLSDLACSPELARALTAALLALREPPTAIVAGADSLAIGSLEALREAGLRVPEDVALVSFDEPQYADLIDPPVTSLDRHDGELGRRAAELLLDALSGGGMGRASSTTPERVDLQLTPRRSCGCRPR